MPRVSLVVFFAVVLSSQGAHAEEAGEENAHDSSPQVLRARFQSFGGADKNAMVRVACAPSRQVEIDGEQRPVDFRIDDAGAERPCPTAKGGNAVQGTLRLRPAGCAGTSSSSSSCRPGCPGREWAM